jgi:uncharacterized protein (TIGR03118 family)
MKIVGGVQWAVGSGQWALPTDFLGRLDREGLKCGSIVLAQRKYPMKFRLPLRLPIRTLPASALITALLIAALLSGALPRSFARTEAPIATNKLQQAPGLVVGGTYRQANLVSDLPGVALIEDRLLKNPWGLALKPDSPFWVSDNRSDFATLYSGDVSGIPLVPNSSMPLVTIQNPTLQPMPLLPTAVVANNTNDFPVLLFPGLHAQFIIATLNGAINVWEPSLGANAFVNQYLPGHSYTGLAIGSNASGNVLYAVDFANGHIDIFDNNFHLSSVSGNFADASIPANFHPYNIQNLGGALYVSYAAFQFGPNLDTGFVRKFDTNGVRDAAFTINNGPLVDPWGMVIAPTGFGAFSNLLLVGNSRLKGIHDPSISAFHPATGALAGSMLDEGGANIELKGLRGLVFGNGMNAGDPNTLYFARGLTDETLVETHGVFGSLKPASLPASTLNFSNSEYHTNENAGHIDITVTRSGDVSGTATVNYATVDNSATQKSDYEIAVGKLTFNPGDTSKTFRVLIVDDNLAAAGTNTQLDLVLSNPTGAALISPNVAQLFIMDNEFDTERQPRNIVDDTQFFVRQQYFDFLNREPDVAGLNFWTNQILSCGSNQQCIELKRINVSAAFFLSIEFQKTGMLAYLTERATTGELPRYGPFMRDVQALQKDYVFGAPGAAAQLEANIRAFFAEFVTRPEFIANYSGLSNDNYVMALLANGGISTTTGRLMITRLNGAQVVPPNNTSATGLAISRISQGSLDTVDFSLSLKNLSSAQTAAHLHGPAIAGANAPPIVTLPSGEFADFTVHFTAQQGADMRSGRLYLDVHTQNNPDGEIRGQIAALRFQRDVLVEALNAGLINRAEALRLIVEDGDFRQAQLNAAFVLMEYFGYLRRNPTDPPDNDFSGYNFWLTKLNQFNGNFVNADMVKAFITSTEYRRRFGPP